MDTRVFDEAQRKLRRAMVYLAETYDTKAIEAVSLLSVTLEKVEVERDLQRAGEKVGVYRKDQPLWTSKCQLGDPCEVCQAHERRRKLNTACPFAKATTPAFVIPAKTAIALLKDNMAVPGPSKTSVILTFGKIAQLRDRSLKIDQRFLESMVADHFPEASQNEKATARRLRAIFEDEHGYHGTALLPAKQAADDGRILSFAP